LVEVKVKLNNPWFLVYQHVFIIQQCQNPWILPQVLLTIILFSPHNGT